MAVLPRFNYAFILILSIWICVPWVYYEISTNAALNKIQSKRHLLEDSTVEHATKVRYATTKELSQRQGDVTETKELGARNIKGNDYNHGTEDHVIANNQDFYNRSQQLSRGLFTKSTGKSLQNRRYNSAKKVNIYQGYTNITAGKHFPCVLEKERVLNVLPPIETSLGCSLIEENWINTKKGKFAYTQNAKAEIGSFLCNCTVCESNYKPVVPSIYHPILDGSDMQSDTCLVQCMASGDLHYTQYHTGVSYKPHAHRRAFAKLAAKDGQSLNLNIIILGLSTLNKENFKRVLPLSHMTFTKVLGGFDFKGFVATNDGQLLRTVLSGRENDKRRDDVSRWRAMNEPFDTPWVWSQLQHHGYVTQLAEDAPITSRMFLESEESGENMVDHRLKPFQEAFIEIDNEPHCVGSTPRHVNLLNYGRELFEIYKDVPKLSVLLSGDLMDEGEETMHLADADLNRYLIEMYNKGHLDRTVVIMISGWDQRVTEDEIMQPYLGIRFPPWFHETFPFASWNLLSNTFKLIEPIDVRETISSLLGFVGDIPTSETLGRGISLLTPIHAERNCWLPKSPLKSSCPCLPFEEIDTNNPLAKLAAKRFLSTLNNIANSSDRSDFCEPLKLDKISRAGIYLYEEMSDETRPRKFVLLYYLSILVSPTKTRYEGVVRAMGDKNEFIVDINSIHLLNEVNVTSCLLIQGVCFIHCDTKKNLPPKPLYHKNKESKVKNIKVEFQDMTPAIQKTIQGVLVKPLHLSVSENESNANVPVKASEETKK